MPVIEEEEEIIIIIIIKRRDTMESTQELAICAP